MRMLAEDDRPREKLLKNGSKHLSNAELVAILIGSGTRDAPAIRVARQVMQLVNEDLFQLGRLDWQRIKSVRGIGKARYVVIAAALELGRRRSEAAPQPQAQMRCSQDVFQLVGPSLSDLAHEEFWVLFLNQRKAVVSKQSLSSGGIAGTVADLRMIFRAALEHQASSIIVCHNHPSGNLQPSQADKELTRRIRLAGKTMDIPLDDHLIVAANHYYSFADEGLIDL